VVHFHDIDAGSDQVSGESVTIAACAFDAEHVDNPKMTAQSSSRR
jgi:hypothetical protein